MEPADRMRLQIARTEQFGDIMRTTLFAQIAIAAVVGFGGSEGVGLALIVATVTVTLFGILGGATALDDISTLREDMDQPTRETHYGRLVKSRNLGQLKSLSTGLIGLTGLGLVLAIIFS